MKNRKYPYSVTYTRAKGHASELAQKAIFPRGFGAVIAVGGMYPP